VALSAASAVAFVANVPCLAPAGALLGGLVAAIRLDSLAELPEAPADV